MAKCSFCGNEISKGTGLVFVRKDGSLFNFCGRRCEKNLLKLGRKPRTTRWTLEFARVKAVELAAKQHAVSAPEPAGEAQTARPKKEPSKAHGKDSGRTAKKVSKKKPEPENKAEEDS